MYQNTDQGAESQGVVLPAEKKNTVAILKKEIVFEKEFTIYGTPDEPLFLARDIAEFIGYDIAQTNKLISMVERDEKLTIRLLWSGQLRDMWAITENGLYEILFQSRMERAKEFKSRVKEILKTIRKTGRYEVQTLDGIAVPNFSNPADAAEAWAAQWRAREAAEAEAKQLTEKSEVLEEALNIRLGYMTVMQYNQKYKMHWNMKTCQIIGKRLTAYCKAYGFHIGKVKTNDERFSETNTYPVDAWKGAGYFTQSHTLDNNS
jgi:prophage antirepressor-like protein